MTITDLDVQTVTALGDGSTVRYAIGFTFTDNDHVVVYREDTSASPPTFTLIAQGAGAAKFQVTDSGGTLAEPGTHVTMGTAPTATQRLVIRRVVPFTQTTDYDATAAFPAEDHEEQMDKQVMLIQQVNEAVGRAPKFMYSTDHSDVTIPEFDSGEAGYALGVNEDGDGLEWLPNDTATEALALSNTSDSTKGDALIGYKHTGTGATGRTLHARLGDQEFSVKDFGAVGDGTTDDTAAITAAILAASTAGGGTVFFPAGSYKCEGAVLKNYVSLRGVGRSSQLVSTTATSTLGDNSAAVDAVTIRDLRFTTAAGQTSLSFSDTDATTSRVKIENCIFDQGASAIQAARCDSFYVINNWFFGLTENAVQLGSSTQNSTNCFVHQLLQGHGRVDRWQRLQGLRRRNLQPLPLHLRPRVALAFDRQQRDRWPGRRLRHPCVRRYGRWRDGLPAHHHLR
jgi:hypothetical protein